MPGAPLVERVFIAEREGPWRLALANELRMHGTPFELSDAGSVLQEVLEGKGSGFCAVVLAEDLNRSNGLDAVRLAGKQFDKEKRAREQWPVRWIFLTIERHTSL